MRSLIFVLLLAPMLSFANPISTVGGNREFCDDQPPDKIADETKGGGCEVDMVALDKASRGTESLDRLHDLMFDDALLTRLNGALWFQTWKLDLDSGAGLEKEEAMLIELSFVSDAGPSFGGHLLAISFARNRKDAAIVATWLTTPYAGWSFASEEAYVPQKLVSAVLPLGMVDAGWFPDVDIGFDEKGVFIGVEGGESRFFAFPDNAHWRPYRLRNGFVIGSQIKSSIGAKLNWPLLYGY
ncbi:hypothetical protein [Luteimonas panaciterrae]|uniref:hypothetical protein n=1 Tax=Luteimonas panaciterrae TaxID=363885 RepID=UPI001CF95840|nr:hypothetical protein [Luteimonas panaciterrae]